MQITMERLATRLSLARGARKLSQADLATLTGVQQSQISRIEREEIADPSILTVARLAAGLGLTLDALCAPNNDSWIAQIAAPVTPDAAPTATSLEVVSDVLACRPSAWVCAVHSPKGGVAKSTTAMNLAALAAASGAGRVLVIDGDLQCGMTAWRMSGRACTGTIIDVLDSADRAAGGRRAADWRIDYIRDIAGALMTNDAIGVDLLASPEDHRSADRVSPHDLRSVIDAVRSAYTAVIIDCGTELDPVTQAWLRAADDIVLMTEPQRAITAAVGRRAEQIVDLGLGRRRQIHLACIRADVTLVADSVEDILLEEAPSICPGQCHHISDFHRDAIAAGNGARMLIDDSAAYRQQLTVMLEQMLRPRS
jgi:MinD-like ATPase involved in chromosome partitioning or flagellar assembly/transcriptional regulator with XRE-family HTH domain